MSASNLRYEQSKTYPFVHCKFKRLLTKRNGEDVWSRASQLGLYRPWEDEQKLLSLKAVNMLCAEHHKVAWDQDPTGEKKHDGFIFFELPLVPRNPLKRWFNQYPRASYGQLSTDADHYLHLDWKGCGMSVEEYLDIEDTDEGMTELHDGCEFLANIRRGQVTIAKAQDWKDEDKKKALEALVAFEKRVQDLIEKVMHKKLRIMQVMYEPAADGGEPALMDWFEVVFDNEPEYTHTKWEDGRGQKRLVTPKETQV